MRRIDRLIIGEMVGPWVFGVAIFTVLIMAGTVLFKITDYLVGGVPPGAIFMFTIYLLPGIMVKTFSMAVLLAALLSFGRLSSDSEIVAMKAAGASVTRMMAPVAAFALLVAIIAFTVNEQVVSRAAFAGEQLKIQIEKDLRGGKQPIFSQIWEGPKLRGLIMARDFNLRDRRLQDVTVKVYNDREEGMYLIDAPSMRWESKEEWSLGDGARLIELPSGSMINLGATYPKFAPKPPDLNAMLAAQVKDMDVLNMAQMRAIIASKSVDPGFDKSQLANLQYGYYNKIALPLATLIFGLVGAPLGIRSHRTGAATGFWLSVMIIFSYMMLANLMNIYAMGQAIPPYVASFTPIVIGIIFSVVLIWRKNL